MSDNKNLDAMTSEFKRRKAAAEARKAKRQKLWGDVKDTVSGWFDNDETFKEQRTPTWDTGVAQIRNNYNDQANQRASGQTIPRQSNEISGVRGRQPAAQETPSIQQSRLPEDRSPAGLWGNRLSEGQNTEESYDWVKDWSTGRTLEEASEQDRNVQNFLNASGYDVEVDGYFGNQSMNALNTWLEKNGFDSSQGLTEEAKKELARQMEEKYNRLSGGQR